LGRGETTPQKEPTKREKREQKTVFSYQFSEKNRTQNTKNQQKLKKSKIYTRCPINYT